MRRMEVFRVWHWSYIVAAIAYKECELKRLGVPGGGSDLSLTHTYCTKLYVGQPSPSVLYSRADCGPTVCQAKGAFHHAKDSGNFGWNLNRKVRFGFFWPEYSGSPLEVVHLFWWEYSYRNLSFHFWQTGFAFIREFGRETNSCKSHSYWLALFNRKMSFHFARKFPLISDRSIWHHGKHPKWPNMHV